MAASLQIEDFELERLVFEARFPNAFQLWDKAGALSDALAKLWEPLSLTTAQPGSIVFRHGRDMNLAVELGRAVMTLFYPGSKPEVKQIDAFFGVVREHLQLTTLQRVGLRFLLFKKFETLPMAASSVLGVGILSAPKERVFGAEGEPTAAEAVIGFTGKGLGATLRIGAQTRQVSIDLPPEVSPDIKETHETSHGVSLDVDFFTPKEVQAAQMGLAEWIEQVMHVYRRDVPKFL